jgi:protein-L-isoaspartate(D-aspartate) O-methyltransferase
VLDVGTGSGYAAAVISRLASDVYTVERHAELADRAIGVLAELGYGNIHVRVADGTLGWPEEAPFDAILVSAAGPRVPPALKSQLALGGRLVMPVGGKRAGQRLLRVTRSAPDEISHDDLGDVQFVPLIGAEGFAE